MPGTCARALADYVQHRLETLNSLHAEISPDIATKQVAEFHTRLWNAARDGALGKPAATLAVLNPVNEVIDLHSTRVASGRKHLPALVLGLLIGCSLLAIAVIGYGCGMSGPSLLAHDRAACLAHCRGALDDDRSRPSSRGIHSAVRCAP